MQKHEFLKNVCLVSERERKRERERERERESKHASMSGGGIKREGERESQVGPHPAWSLV